VSEAISELRAQVCESRGLPPRSRFSSELRERLLAVVAEEQGQDRSIQEISEDLGLRLKTLKGWLRDAGRTKSPVLRRVVLAPEERCPLPTRALIVSMGNLRVEGLDLEGLVHLLRALA
jgi:transposase-like protein